MLYTIFVSVLIINACLDKTLLTIYKLTVHKFGEFEQRERNVVRILSLLSAYIPKGFTSKDVGNYVYVYIYIFFQFPCFWKVPRLVKVVVWITTEIVILLFSARDQCLSVTKKQVFKCFFFPQQVGSPNMNDRRNTILLVHFIHLTRNSVTEGHTSV